MLYRKKMKLILCMVLSPQCFLTVDEIRLYLLELEETKGSDTEATEMEQTL